MQQESFEVQAKVHVSDPDVIIEALLKDSIEVVYSRHYHEYDTYFFLMMRIRDACATVRMNLSTTRRDHECTRPPDAGWRDS